MKKIIILFCIVLLAGCETANNEFIIPPKVHVMVQDINKIHEQIDIVDNPFDQMMIPLDEGQYNRDMTYLLKHNIKTNGRLTLTSQQAQEDVTKLFSLFKSMYCGYPIYGEEPFMNAEKIALDQIKQSEDIDKQQLIRLLQEALSFIKDAHLQIDFRVLHDVYKTYYAEADALFEKKDDHYYRQGSDSPVLLIQNDTNLTTYLKPHYVSNGDVFYRLFYQSDQAIAEIELQYSNGRIENISVAEDHRTYEDEKDDTDLPYAHPKKMPYPKMDQDQKKEACDFLEKADEFRKANISILDLRGNTGGNAILSYEWIQRFTGTKLNGKAYRFLRMPLENDQFQRLMDVNSDQSIKDLQAVSSFIKMDNFGYLSVPERKIQKNDSILFVLQNGGTASAAEMLIDFLHNVENVVFIGTPSLGLLEGSAMMPIYLENSGIQVVFGNLCSVYSDSYAKELQGIQPDIWVPSKEALSYILSLLDVQN